MGDVQDDKDGRANHQAAVEVDTFLDLNFVPQWARRPPDTVHAGRFSDRDAGGRDRDSRGGRGGRDAPGRDRRSRAPRSGDTDRGARPFAKPKRGAEGFDKDPRGAPDPRADAVPMHREEAVAGRPGRSESPRYDAAPQPDLVHAQFLPERKAVLELGKRIAGSHKAYPLLDLAGVLLSREGLCYVRLEMTTAAQERTLHQCQLCRTVALDRETLVAHIVDDHLADYFDVETETVDPPSGVFVCVALCGLSGKLLGPPNHHSYTEAVKAVHAEHFGHMDFERYRSRIRTSHDPADVERWKASCTTRTVYRRKVAEGEEVAESVTLKDAQQFMADEVVDRNIKSLRRVVLREAEAHAVRDPLVRGVLHRAWQREVRFPIQVALALRAALRSRHLHVFKAGGGKGMHFVTGVKPVALNPESAVPTIREALRYLEGHPGCTREEMIHDLVGEDVPPDDPRVKELLQPISWLTERGHIIEFFNGRLAVPRHV